MSTLMEELTAIKAVEDRLTANKVANFAYTDHAYNNPLTEADGVETYDVDNEQNIPVANASTLKVNTTILTKGWRAQASAITRMLMNHFLGRCSYNLNKINDLFSLLLTKFMAFLGSPNGIATLDANGRIPYSQLPESAVELKGYWDADTNTPTLADGTGTNGDEYIVEVAGTQDLGSGSQYFNVGDRVLYAGGTWKNITSGFIRTVNNNPPDNLGNIEAVLGSNTFPITRKFLSFILNTYIVRQLHHSISANSTYSIYELAYANGVWIDGSYLHGIWWSEDGKNWTQGLGDNANKTMDFMVYANGIWACGVQGIWWSEDNGKNWERGTGDASNVTEARNMTYAEGTWVSGSNRGLLYSKDGKDWSQVKVGGVKTQISSGMDYNTIHYADGLWVAGGQNSVYWSEDGENWTAGSVDVSSYYLAYVTYANGIWVAGGAGLYWSEDGKAWTRSLNLANAVRPTYNGSIWVASIQVGSSYALAWSEDGKTWTTGTNTTNYISDIAYANGIWVAGGVGLYWSEDGKAWTKSTDISSVDSLAYVNGLWVCGSVSTGAWWSADGKSWTKCMGTGSTSLRKISFAKGRLVLGSNQAGMWYSDSIEDLIADGSIDLGADIPIVNE